MSLKESIYDILKDRIVNCIYPPGTLLKEREIIEELGVSRTPFREAIAALMYEDLVQIVPYKGAYVAEITLKDIENLYDVRERLELYALELCMKNIPMQELQNRCDALNANGISAYSEAMQQDEDIHAMLLQYADNRLLRRLMDGLYDQIHRVRVLSTTQDRVIEHTRDEHKDILEAMLAQDVQKASDAMRAHINGSKQRALDILLHDNDKLYFRL